MTANQAPIFQSLDLARKWVNQQSLDEELMLCEVKRKLPDGSLFAVYEFHNLYSAFSMNNDNTVSKWIVLESWH